MSFNVIATPRFKRELKRLSKKYSSLKNEYAALVENLEMHPDTGIPIGNDCYKIRLAIASKGKGKSGSARIITYLYVSDRSVFLLSIYNKGEQDDIANKALWAMIKNLK
jgi:mRNA-degrading endonuclease RelE of RelBE toxin-antitoxin system